MIEYNSQYLGRGKVSIKLTALKHELRRDEYCPPQKCQIKSVKWCLNAQLYGAARFWRLLDGGSNLSMSQFFERISDYVESEISVTAMAIESGSEQLILMSADVAEESC